MNCLQNLFGRHCGRMCSKGKFVYPKIMTGKIYEIMKQMKKNQFKSSRKIFRRVRMYWIIIRKKSKFCLEIDKVHQNLFRIYLFRFYLFIHERHTERDRDTGRRRSRFCAGGLMWDSIPALCDHALSWRQTLNHWAIQASLFILFFK